MELLKNKAGRKRIKGGDILHFLFIALLPVAVFVLASQWDLYSLAVILILLSKWRIFAVQPRFWRANVQANLVDLIFSLSMLNFMYQARGDVWVQAIWMVMYGAWLVLLKPRSSTPAVTAQAAIAQAVGLTALFYFSYQVHDIVIIAGSWLIAASSARHLIGAYDEEHADFLSATWGLIVTQLAWLLNRWVVVYNIGDHLFIPQLCVIVIILGYCIAHIYHLAKNGRLNTRQVQYTFGLGGLLLFFVLSIFSNWSGSI